MSALPLKADIVERGRHVRFVPATDITCAENHRIAGNAVPRDAIVFVGPS